MRLYTKRIRVISMTEEEMRVFYETMEKARQGQTAHYAETPLADGSFLGVSMEEPCGSGQPDYSKPAKAAKY